MTSTLTGRGSTRRWRELRAHWTPLVAAGHVTCWRCGQPIHPGQPWDLGHRTDRALGGTDHDTAPEHRHRTGTCPGNRAAGATTRRPSTAAPSRPW
jgi:hypothetical protein